MARLELGWGLLDMMKNLSVRTRAVSDRLRWDKLAHVAAPLIYLQAFILMGLRAGRGRATSETDAVLNRPDKIDGGRGKAHTPDQRG